MDARASGACAGRAESCADDKGRHLDYEGSSIDDDFVAQGKKKIRESDISVGTGDEHELSC